MNELLPEYLASLHATGHAPGTINNYRQRITAFLRWQANRPLTGRLLIDYSIYLQTVHEGREGGGCRPRTIRGHFAALASFWKFALGYGYRDLPPISAVPQPRLDPERNVMPTDEQVDRLTRAAQRVGRDATDQAYRDYLLHRAVMIITLGLDLGLRRSEMRNLNVEDLRHDAKGRHLRVRRSKGGEGRTIPIPEPTWQKIQAWLDVRNERVKKKGAKIAALMIDQQCRRMGDRSIDKALDQVLLLAGLEDSGITPHSLRHGCATQLIRQGVDVPTIQKILGHSNMETTLRYLHTDYAQMQTAMNSLGARLSGESPSVQPLPPTPPGRLRRESGGLRRTSRANPR
jgi:site-specific recombinase XerD